MLDTAFGPKSPLCRVYFVWKVLNSIDSIVSLRCIHFMSPIWKVKVYMYSSAFQTWHLIAQSAGKGLWATALRTCMPEWVSTPRPWRRNDEHSNLRQLRSALFLHAYCNSLPFSKGQYSKEKRGGSPLNHRLTLSPPSPQACHECMKINLLVCRVSKQQTICFGNNKT